MRFATSLQGDIAIYNRDDTLLIASTKKPPTPLTEETLSYLDSWHPFKQPNGIWVHAIRLNDKNSPYLLITSSASAGHRFWLLLTTVLAAVALASWPLARAFVRPLEQLIETSRVLAQGDLSARSGISRKDEIGELASALDGMAIQLEERIRNEKELFANISHEIRTPLARLRFALELCEDVSGDAAQVLKHLHGMGADLAELELLVNNVLVSSRLEALASGAGEIPLQLQPIELTDFFARVADRFTRHHPENTLEMKVVEKLLGANLDPVLINRVCDNLLENAAKYSAPASKISLNAKIEENWLKVEVVDAGEGVDGQDLPRLFDPFFRGDRSRSRQTGGTGLGLALCKRIIEAHGGKITASLNSEGRGMSFRFELPIKDSFPAG